jgi:C4-type Zn-finger protein
MGEREECPVCGNRLFDLISQEKVEFIMKCPRCKNKIHVIGKNTKRLVLKKVLRTQSSG